MFKKISLLALVTGFGVANIAMANGFYAGANAGVSNLNNDLSFDSTDGGDFTGKVDTGDTGVTGGFLGGYTFNFASKLNLGVEAFANMDSSKTNANVNGYGSLELKQRYAYGLRMLPGYQVTKDTDVHLLAGYVRGNFRLRDNGLLDPNLSKTFNANGYQLGFGMGTDIVKNIGVRADVIYSGYQSKKVYGSVPSDTYTNRIHTVDGVAALVYKFG